MSNQLNPYPAEKQQLIVNLLNESSSDQLYWLSGYLTGIVQERSATFSGAKALQQDVSQSGKVLTILYGTHTGHGEQIARNLEEKALQKGIATELMSLDDFKTRGLNKIEHLALVVSTHGEGEPPLMAESLYEFVKSGKARLANLNYSVLALGDRSYKYFCKTGIDFDNWLRKSGGKEIIPLVKCDVDYESVAAKWINDFLSNVQLETDEKLNNVKPHLSTQRSKYNKQNPFYAEVLDKRKITGRFSDKEVWHVELSLEGSDLTYEPGDALGVFTNNPPELVQEIIESKGLSPNATITTKYDDVTLYEALFHHFEITVLTRKVLEDYNQLAKNKALSQLLDDEAQLENYLYGNDLLDLLNDFPVDLSPLQLTSILRYLPPRLYSISSSHEANPGEVHITVARVDYEYRSRKRKGACSTYISERLLENEKLPVFIEKNLNFRLPANDNAPVILIGSGTGVAPYRSFLQEIEEKERKNKSWLFYGDRTFNEDFLYQIEWQRLVKKGKLDKINLAFSRDQEEKIYVQHRLKENSSEVFNWIQNGAHLYICGDRKRLFHDVQNTLLEIIQEQGGMTPEKAGEYLKNLRKEKRYQTDVY